MRLPDPPPDILIHARIYWDAYEALDATREYTDGGFPRPIAMAELVAFCTLMGFFNGASRRLLYAVVAKLDSIKLPFERDKILKERAKAERIAAMKRRRGGA